MFCWQHRRQWASIVLIGSLLSTMSFCKPDRAIAVDPAKPVLPAKLRAANIWLRVLGSAKMPAPWRVAPCEGTAPLLCVSHQRDFVGTVELGTYLLESRADFRKLLTNAGIPAKANAADPKYRSRLITALTAWVNDYYAFFKKDRIPEYGDTITFTPQPPTSVTVGKLTGLRYGFAGIKQTDRGIHEQRVGYVAFDGTTLYVITTAVDAMSETGKFKTIEDFQRFEPYLQTLVAGLQLPIARPARR